jgi:hypothetical protein
MTTEQVANELMGLGMIADMTPEESRLLDGLGQMVRLNLSPGQKLAVNAYANQKANQVISNTLTTPGMRYLLAQNNNNALPAEIRNDIRKGKARFVVDRKYFRKQVGAGSADELVKHSENEITGVRNINEGVLSDIAPVAISAIKVSYGFGGVGTEPANIAYTNASDAETGGTIPVAVPAALLNGELEFLNDTTGEVFLRCPVKNFFRDGLSVSGQVEGKMDALQIKPQLFQPKHKIQVKLRTARTLLDQPIAFPVGNHFIEVQFFCDTFGKKVEK